MFLSLFQTASGSWHWPSILTASGWLLGAAISGAFLFSQLVVQRSERIQSFNQEQYRVQKIKDLESAIEIRPFTFRLKEVLDKIDPNIITNLKHGQTTFKLKLPHNLYSRLQDLCAEKDSASYVQISPLSEKDNFEESSPVGLLYGINISLSPKFLSSIKKK